MKVFSRYLLLLLIVLLAGCNADEPTLKNGETTVTEEMNEVISNYIVEKYKDIAAPTDQQFEVHKVYGTNEENDVTHLYIWSYYAGFNIATGKEEQSGHSLPALIDLKTTESGYEVVNYTEPEDGSEWTASLEKMFPKKYVKKAHQDAVNIDSLEKEMDKKVAAWLDEQ